MVKIRKLFYKLPTLWVWLCPVDISMKHAEKLCSLKRLLKINLAYQCQRRPHRSPFLKKTLKTLKISLAIHGYVNIIVPGVYYFTWKMDPEKANAMFWTALCLLKGNNASAFQPLARFNLELQPGCSYSACPHLFTPHVPRACGSLPFSPVQIHLITSPAHAWHQAPVYWSLVVACGGDWQWNWAWQSNHS